MRTNISTLKAFVALLMLAGAILANLPYAHAQKINLATQVTGVTGTANGGTAVSSSGTAGLILRSNGTIWQRSQTTYPDLIASGNVLFATAANTIGSSTDLTFISNVLAVAGNINATTASGYGLSITTAANAFTGMQIARTVNTASSWDIYTPAGSTDLRFFNSGADRLTVTSTGLNNTVIGATTPAAMSATTGSFSGTISKTNAAATQSQFMSVTGSTTSATFGQIQNTGALGIIGIENNAGGAVVTGSGSYSAFFGTQGATATHLVSNGTVTLTSNSTGTGISITSLTTTGAATGKTIVCADTNGVLYRSSSAVTCAN